MPPLPASLRCARSSTGASFSHGPHHEAQKFSTTTLPRSWASEPPPWPSSTGSVTPAPGAAGRCPLRTAESSDVSSRRATTP